MERKRLMHVFDKWLLVKSEFQFGLVTYNLKWCIYEPTHELEKHNSGDPLYGFFPVDFCNHLAFADFSQFIVNLYHV